MKGKSRIWSQVECKKLIIANRDKLPWNLVAKHLNRSVDDCRTKMNKLKNNIDFKFNRPKKNMHVHKVTDEVVEALKENLLKEIPQMTVRRR